MKRLVFEKLKKIRLIWKTQQQQQQQYLISFGLTE